MSGTGADESTTAKVKVTAETNVKISFKKNAYSVSFDAQVHGIRSNFLLISDVVVGYASRRQTAR